MKATRNVSARPRIRRIGSVLTVRHRLGASTVEIVSATGALVAVHRHAVGGLIRLPDHRAALEAVVLGAFSTAAPCVPNGHHPPAPVARAAVRLRTASQVQVVVVAPSVQAASRALAGSVEFWPSLTLSAQAGRDCGWRSAS
jgi:hypothetical protein